MPDLARRVTFVAFHLLLAMLTAAALVSIGWRAGPAATAGILTVVVIQPLVWAAFAYGEARRSVVQQDEGDDEDGDHLEEGEDTRELVQRCDARSTDGQEVPRADV